MWQELGEGSEPLFPRRRKLPLNERILRIRTAGQVIQRAQRRVHTGQFGGSSHVALHQRFSRHDLIDEVPIGLRRFGGLPGDCFSLGARAKRVVRL